MEKTTTKNHKQPSGNPINLHRIFMLVMFSVLNRNVVTVKRNNFLPAGGSQQQNLLIPLTMAYTYVNSEDNGAQCIIGVLQHYNHRISYMPQQWISFIRRESFKPELYGWEGIWILNPNEDLVLQDTITDHWKLCRPFYIWKL